MAAKSSFFVLVAILLVATQVAFATVPAPATPTYTPNPAPRKSPTPAPPKSPTPAPPTAAPAPPTYTPKPAPPTKAPAPAPPTTTPAPAPPTYTPTPAPPKIPTPLPPKAPSPPVKPPATPAPPLPPVKSRKDCIPLCTGRCKLHSRLNICVRACLTCCDRCKCVPPGTYGNKEMCGKCYTEMRTHGNRYKCP